MAFDTKLRMTQQRRVILDELKNDRSHPTADEVYARVRKRLPRISLGTVYRNLETLTERGMIQKLHVADSPKRFDGHVGMHYHVRCERCGRIDDAPARPLGDVERSVSKATGYRITGHRLEFEGLCPRCKRRKASTE